MAAIVPWNSPLLLTAFKAATALAAGCTIVVKPASVTPTSSLEFAKLVQEAGFPDGVFNVVTGSGERVGTALVQHPGVDKVAFIGSNAAGIEVARNAAEHLARVSLELGGKSPNIIFADADLAAAVNGAVAGIFAATGQTCLAGSRILVERSVHDNFVEGLATARTIKLGDPMLSDTEMGPVAFPEHFANILGYIAVAKSEGAAVAAGGGRPKDMEGGLFVEPTILINVRNDSRIAQEKVLAPWSASSRSTPRTKLCASRTM